MKARSSVIIRLFLHFFLYVAFAASPAAFVAFQFTSTGLTEGETIAVVVETATDSNAAPCPTEDDGSSSTSFAEYEDHHLILDLVHFLASHNDYRRTAIAEPRSLTFAPRLRPPATI